MRNAPTVNKVYGIFLKAPKSRRGAGALRSFRGFKRLNPTIAKIMLMNPHILTAHGKPTFGVKNWIRAGYRIAPLLDPHPLRDTASERFFLKYVATFAVAGMNINPAPIP